MKSKVSIITPTLNAAGTIENTIKSVVEQTYPNIEHIIVDGGSADGTVNIIKKHKDKISKFVSEKDKGIFDGMNKGIKMAGGEIIGILNSDDIYATKDAIETVVENMQKNKAEVCWGDLVYINPKEPDKIKRYWKSSSYKKGKFKKAWMPPHPTFFVKKKTYNKYGLFNLDFPISADFELMLRFLAKYKTRSCYIPKILVKMKLWGNSNKSIKKIIKGNLECYKAFKINNLKVNPLRFFFKPFIKIPQFFKKHD